MPKVMHLLSGMLSTKAQLTRNLRHQEEEPNTMAVHMQKLQRYGLSKGQIQEELRTIRAQQSQRAGVPGLRRMPCLSLGKSFVYLFEQDVRHAC